MAPNEPSMATTEPQRPLAERRFLKVPEAARMLNVPDHLVRRLIKQGALPAVRVGKKMWRVDAEHLEESIEELHAATREWLLVHPHERRSVHPALSAEAQANWGPAHSSPLPVDAEMMTVHEARRALGSSSRQVYYLINSGRLRARKAGPRWLVSSEDVEALVPRIRARNVS